MLFVLIFLIHDGARIWRFVLGAVPQHVRRRADVAGRRAFASLVGYTRATVVVAAVDAVTAAVGLWVIGVPLVVPLATLIFFGAFVPTIGAVVTGIVAVLVALASGGWVDALLVIGLLLIVQNVEGYILQPLLLGRSVRLHPLAVVLPISFFELAGRARFNSIAIIDADGSNLGIYRKSHIPDGPGYHEKYYFNPGDTGFKVWQTRYAKIGVGICWDQWFPECARSMALMGAELLFYPTAIGSEPHDHSINSRDHWQRVQQGHAGANLMPLIASNRIGREEQDGYDITFYGSSFIANQFGEKVQELNETETGVLVQSFDLDELERIRSAWGVFRDRRPNLYGPLRTLDGELES